MELILFLFKFYIIVLLFRFISTQQELTFNPIGRVVATLTNPLINAVKVKKAQEKTFIILMIFTLVMIGSLSSVVFLAGNQNAYNVFFVSVSNFVAFFMIFIMASVLVGSLVSIGSAGLYVTYFFRIAMPWVKLTRTFIPISSGAIVVATIPIIFLVFLSFQFLLLLLSYTLTSASFTVVVVFKQAFIVSIIGISTLFSYAAWLIVVRALMSWVSPDPRNVVVQLIYGLTEPILAPFRRLVPPIGIIDLSAMVAIFLLFFISSALKRAMFLL